MRSFMSVMAGILIGLTPAMPVMAEEAPANPLLGMHETLKSFFTEEDIRTLLDFMRDAALAAAKGETVTLPPELAFKLAILRKRLEKESGAALGTLKEELDRQLDRALREFCRERKSPEAHST